MIIHCTATPGKRTIKFIILDSKMYIKYIHAIVPFSIKKISNIYVYSDIVELYPVGISQVPILKFLQIKCNFQKIGH